MPLNKKLFSFSSREIRYLGFGALITIIALISVLGIIQTSRIEKQLYIIETGPRTQLRSIDHIISEFIGLRELFSKFVIEEETYLKPILKSAKQVQTNAEGLQSKLQNEAGQAIMASFIEKLKEYRAGMVAYSQELLIRRTGEGVRSWEETLLNIERQAHDLGMELKNLINDNINNMNSNILLNGKKTKTWSIAFGILGVLSGILVAFFLHKALSRPIKELILVSGKVADGDLSIEIDRTGSDEIVVLSRAINTMVNNLQRIVKGIKTAYIEVESTAHSLNKHSVEASKGAELQGLEINKVASSVNEMNSIFKDISSNVKTLTSSLDQSSSSTYEMSTAIKNVFSMADRIAKEIETISSSQLQMNTNMGQTVEFLNTLSTTSQQMTNTVKDLTASINKVGQHAEKSKSLAEGVTRMAREQGVSAVEDVVNITRKNKQLVDNYSQLIYSLGKRSTSIGKILDVIRGIVDQTNLLSLNASIIAAQAGEHGRSFAVVADEIRTLSDTTTTNVKQIEEVIKGVSSEVDEAVKLIQEVKEGADSSISLAVQAGKTLQEIDDISNQSTQMAREIADAVDIQVSHSDNILDVVTNNTQEVMVAKKAVDEQKRGNDLIVASVKELTSIAGKLKNSTEEQADGSDIISKTITEMHEFSQEIMMAMDEEQRTSQYVVESLDRISEVANNNLSAMESLATMVNELGALANKLGPEVSKFKLPIHYEKEDGLAIEPFNKKTEPVMPQALHPSTENTL